jgi:mono/diheme cytochrome c family protein
MTRFFVLLLLVLQASLLPAQSAFRPVIPKVWDDAALADWATPVAGLNVRPTHLSAKEYYSLPVDNRRTYPVYYPGQEPEGYWEMLQHVAPKALIEPDKLKTKTDWIDAGRRIFAELDDLHLRTRDPKIVAAARSPKTFEAVGAQPLPDGTVYGLRWVPTERGVALSLQNCSGCHLLYLPDDTPVPGAPSFAGVARDRNSRHRVPLIGPVHAASHAVTGVAPFIMGSQPLGASLYQAFGVPWKEGDVNGRLKTFTREDLEAYAAAAILGGAISRWNGSLLFPSKVPDLIGIEGRKYIDSTATHLHRGIGDLMRYAALVSFADTTDFGAYHMLLPDSKRVPARLPDEALYALALYIYSLQPPPNPNARDEKARAGEKIFVRERCAGCHTPPLYTSNKLTLAQGFTAPKDKPVTLDVLQMSVGTDPGLALDTRKGTGYYKVPSLKGLWYRGHYLHDGSVASLEEMFNPGRLQDSHLPGGWTPPGTKARAIKGHEFGLKLDPTEREQLIAFLRTL